MSTRPPFVLSCSTWFQFWMHTTEQFEMELKDGKTWSNAPIAEQRLRLVSRHGALHPTSPLSKFIRFALGMAELKMHSLKLKHRGHSLRLIDNRLTNTPLRGSFGVNYGCLRHFLDVTHRRSMTDRMAPTEDSAVVRAEWWLLIDLQSFPYPFLILEIPSAFSFHAKFRINFTWNPY